MSAARAARPAAPRGQHFLRPAAAADFVARLGPDLGLILDIGAGTGALTTVLATRAERVVAIEADARLAARLARRTASCSNVTVVSGDVLHRPLPRRPFRVAANLPFAGSTAILRHLLDGNVAHQLQRADVIVQLGAARGWTARTPSRADAVSWYPWFSVRFDRRIPARSFTPVPSVDGAVLTVVRRPAPLLPYRCRAPFASFVAAGFRSPRIGDVVRMTAGPRAVSAVCRRADVERSAPPSDVPASRWLALFAAMYQRA